MNRSTIPKSTFCLVNDARERVRITFRCNKAPKNDALAMLVLVKGCATPDKIDNNDDNEDVLNR